MHISARLSKQATEAPTRERNGAQLQLSTASCIKYFFEAGPEEGHLRLQKASGKQRCLRRRPGNARFNCLSNRSLAARISCARQWLLDWSALASGCAADMLIGMSITLVEARQPASSSCSSSSIVRGLAFCSVSGGHQHFDMRTKPSLCPGPSRLAHADGFFSDNFLEGSGASSILHMKMEHAQQSHMGTDVLAEPCAVLGKEYSRDAHKVPPSSWRMARGKA